MGKWYTMHLWGDITCKHFLYKHLFPVYLQGSIINIVFSYLNKLFVDHIFSPVPTGDIVYLINIYLESYYPTSALCTTYLYLNRVPSVCGLL